MHFGGAGAIPLLAILAYCFWRQLDPDEVVPALRSLDAEFLRILQERREGEEAERQRKLEQQSRIVTAGGYRARGR